MNDAHLTVSKWSRIDAAGLGACALITAGAYLLIVEPAMHNRAALHDQQIELANRQDELSQKTAKINVLRGELDSLHRAAGGADRPIELQSLQQSNRRLADLSQLAAENMLDVHEMRLGSATFAPQFQIARIHLSGRGTFQSCAAFLARLRQQYRDTGVVLLELSDNPSDPSEKTAFRFELTWFAAPALASAGK